MAELKGVSVWLALRRVTREVEGVARGSVAALALCPTDFGVLEALLNRGPMRVSALGEAVMLTSGSTTSAVDRLTDKSLVRRTIDMSDARARVVELTDEGRALIEQAFARHAGMIERTFAPLTAAERSELLTLLLKLRRGVRAQAASS